MPNIQDARILIIATDGFEDSELLEPRKRLVAACADVCADRGAFLMVGDVALPEGQLCSKTELVSGPSNFVIPAYAGIQRFTNERQSLDARVRGHERAW